MNILTGKTRHSPWIRPLDEIRDLLCLEWAHYKRDLPHDDCPSQDMCLLSTTYLYWLFKHAGLKGWEPAEGVGMDDQGESNPGGMKAVNDRWYSHNWLVHTSGVILDLTGDQFGHEEIILATKDDPRYNANRSSEYAKQRVSSCRLGKEWLKFQLEDPDSSKLLSSILRSLGPGHGQDLSCP
ncbi:hypothetical protein [Pseudomonas sp. CFBP 13719]|uniref:hypothetical protein n=1 Tax=Pseudomonas sp. CFBP 13719 TaxID=2775303 RepID=UPI001FD4DAA1|nr:hypothetical protein [Pseudomonas sp. CFBP 13719]